MPWWLCWLWFLWRLRSLRWPFLMTISHDNFWWQFLMTISDDNFWWQFLMTIFDDNFWWQFLMTISDDNFWWQFLICMLMLMLDLWLQAETPGVTHFGAYHRPPDGHFFPFYCRIKVYTVLSWESTVRWKAHNVHKSPQLKTKLLNCNLVMAVH